MTTTNGPLGSKHRAWSALALAVSLTGAGAVARADALLDLREQTEALQRKVNELEDAQKKTAPASVVTAPPAENPIMPTRSGETPHSEACCRTYVTAANPSSIANGRTLADISWNFCRSATNFSNS